jgi:hypothetical protein
MDEKSLSEEQDIPVYKELPKAKEKKREPSALCMRPCVAFSPTCFI